MSAGRRKKDISLKEFSIDREVPGIFGMVFQCILYGSIAIFGDWLLYVAIRDDWHIGFYFFAPLFFVSLFISLIPVIMAGVVIWALFIKFLAGDEHKPDSRQIFLDTLQADIKTLAKKQMQLTTKDEYGIPNSSKWEKELRRYVRDVLPKKLDPEHHGSGILWLSSQKNVQKLREMIDTERQTLISADSKIDELNPLEFEQYCSRRLEAMGWSASITKASGDQGADVLAHKDGQSLVLQVKKYSKPVGNKAVQEAIAAQKYYLTDIAAVVTNQSYTKSAHELANMSGILLLHHTELDVFN